jgi:short-subunit dehydrogenase
MKSNKTALVTGASSGIGKELARIHAERGGDLVITARREERLNALKEELEEKHGVEVMVIVKDLRLPDAPQEIYDEVKKAGVEVDYLINNAGHGALGKFYKLPMDRNLDQIKLNVMAVTKLTYLFLPDFVKRNAGKILFTSSTASLSPGPLQAVYFATKSYITFLSNALAEELSDTNITVTALLPGATDTEFGAIVGVDKTVLWDNLATARSVAEDGYKAMLAGQLDLISGLTWSQRLLVFLQPVLPKPMLLKTMHRLQTPIR